MLAFGPFGLKRQAGLRLGGRCSVWRFRLLCVHLIFMPWLVLTVSTWVIRDHKLGWTNN